MAAFIGDASMEEVLRHRHSRPRSARQCRWISSLMKHAVIVDVVATTAVRPGLDDSSGGTGGDAELSVQALG
jgi:hypothetical protein